MANHVHTPTPPTIVTSRRIAVVTALLALSSASAPRPSNPENLPEMRASLSPDAELIRLCVEVGVHRDRFNTESTLDARECPIWAAYTRAADAISDAEPQTLAGMVAKAHAAKLEATNMHGEEDPAGTMAEDWAWDLVNDLIRLFGRA